MGKTKEEVETMLKSDEVIELKLTERKGKKKGEDGDVLVME